MEPSQSLKTSNMETAIDPAGLPEHKENLGVPKSYYFQTETKRLKAYYLQHSKDIIGIKVLFNNSPGIVRYFGQLQHTGKPVSDHKQLWVGIEWDEDNRGKHNGTVNSFQYFKCAANKGSMIKYEKIEFGYRLEIALFKRYFKVEELHHAKDIFDNLKLIKEELKELEKQGQEQIKGEKLEETIKKKIHKIQYDAEAYLDTVKQSKKILIEFVGFDQIWHKINSLDKIQSISLADCRICDLGPLGHLQGLLKNLRELSLEGNLLSDWNQIYQLGYQLPHLNQLSLSQNKFEEPPQNFQEMKEVHITGRKQSFDLEGGTPFKSLRCLILIKTELTWRTFFKIIGAFRFVEEFILCKNDLSDFSQADPSKLKYLQRTKFINLEQTNLTDFTQLQLFSELPRLERLILNKNPLKKIGRNVKGFDNLKHLSVQLCSFSQPVVLYEISLISSLQSVNVKHNIMGDLLGNSYIRMRAVAEIQKLIQINGAPLKKVERKDFEIFYLRQTFREYFIMKKVPDYDYDFEDFLKFCQEYHPNIKRLIKKYGNPYEVEKKDIQVLIKEEVKATENKKGTGMVDIRIEYKDNGFVDKKKIPLSWTLSSLKNFFSKTNKHPAGKLRLTCISDPDSSPQEMTEDHKTLSYYSLKPGSVIIVERLP